MHQTHELTAINKRIMKAMKHLSATLNPDQQAMLREIDDLHVEELMLVQICA